VLCPHIGIPVAPRRKATGTLKTQHSVLDDDPTQEDDTVIRYKKSQTDPIAMMRNGSSRSSVASTPTTGRGVVTRRTTRGTTRQSSQRPRSSPSSPSSPSFLQRVMSLSAAWETGHKLHKVTSQSARVPVTEQGNLTRVMMLMTS
jgi:hypothetical protein